MSDLISRDAAIAAIETARQAFALPDDVPGSRLVNAGFAAARGAVEKVPSGWIPIAERMPEENTMVLICSARGRRKKVEAAYYRRYIRKGINKIEWSVSTYTSPEVPPTHWMELPSPPKN